MCRIKGLEKFICYDKFWLGTDMDAMGDLFENCDEYCHNLYGVWIDKMRFLKDFMNSDMRVLMEVGHPRLLTQHPMMTVKAFVELFYHSDLSGIESDLVPDTAYNQFYWVGWMYAFMHYQSKRSSEDIIKLFPLDEMLWHYYPAGHCEREYHFYDKVKIAFGFVDEED